ncbi:MAG: hypothetical protein NVS4B2_00740 [Chloroflexota bacterium]
MNTVCSALRSRLQLGLGLTALAAMTAACSLPFASSSANTTHHHARLLALAHGKHLHAHVVRHVFRRPPPVPFPERRAFALHVIPILDHSTVIFDHAVAAVSSAGGLGNMSGPCADYLSQVQIQASYLDGVPRPFAWYSAAGSLSHQIWGIYHDMSGALQSCQTAIESQDSGTAATAIADMSSAAARLHGIDNYSRWVLHH